MADAEDIERPAKKSKTETTVPVQIIHCNDCGVSMIEYTNITVAQHDAIVNSKCVVLEHVKHVSESVFCVKEDGYRSAENWGDELQFLWTFVNTDERTKSEEALFFRSRPAICESTDRVRNITLLCANYC
jgi:hypothetical protein